MPFGICVAPLPWRTGRGVRIGAAAPARNLLRCGAAMCLLAAISTISACASPDGAATVLVAGARVEHVLAGTGGPVVVLESGLGGALAWWSKVLPDIAKSSTVFAYNRPGIGESSPPVTPREGRHVVDELRQVLRARGLAPPYVLVGHSLGGLYMQLFARRFPDDVAGLVLIDSTHPEQLSGAGARENWPTWLEFALSVSGPSVARSELDGIPKTGADVLAMPPVAGKPTIVLSASRPMRETSSLARDGNAKRIDILRLNPGAKQVWVDSGHAIPLDRPDAVVGAIREVLERSREAAASAPMPQIQPRHRK